MLDTLGNRMKSYEAVSDFVLTSRLPVIIRLDGNSFSKFTKEMVFKKPFDPHFDRAMEAAAEAVLAYTHGLLAYVQSDEITVLLRNDRSHEEVAFLGNRVQKLVSLAAATATTAFTEQLRAEGYDPAGTLNMPVFDARVFVVPPDDVNNVFLWRQKDAFKNCVNSVAYYGLCDEFGKSAALQMLFGKSTKERQEIIFQQLVTNINDLPTQQRRGRCLYRQTYEMPVEEMVETSMRRDLIAKGHLVPGTLVTRSRIVVDREIPEFHLDPEYIGKYLR